VLGADKTGIIAGVTAKLAELEINILDITQTTMQNLFTMIMLVDFEKSEISFHDVVLALEETGKELNVQVRMQREDIFYSMHRV
jgi:ACT domain-containing protein